MHHGQNRENKKTQIKTKNVNFAEIAWEMCKCCGNRGKCIHLVEIGGQYAICIIGLGEWTPLSLFRVAFDQGQAINCLQQLVKLRICTVWEVPQSWGKPYETRVLFTPKGGK